jgi:two-component system, cell cycle response regulator
MTKMPKILIVDDEDFNVILLEKRLSKAGYEVEKAFNGYEALALIQKEKFDMVLLDVMMPEIDGFEVARILNNDPEFKDIPVIFLSAKNSVEDKIEGLSIGAADYITKPFDFRELEARIKIILNNQKEKIEIKKEAYIDFLTGAFNRRYVENLIKKEFEEASVCSLLMMDLDYFKRINDTYGHDDGDVVLKETSLIITNTLNGSGVLGRYGGEEFIAVLPNIHENAALILAENIRKSIENHIFVLKKINERITLSIGVATSIKKERIFSSVETFIKASDEALYKAKNTGRNRSVSY